MAMTASLDVTVHRELKHTWAVKGNFDCDTSYPTGGYDASIIQPRIKDMIIYNHNALYEFVYKPSTNKILAYHYPTATPDQDKAEVSNGTDLSSITGVEFVAFIYPD